MTKDLPLAIREEYSTINGAAQSIFCGSKLQTIEIGDSHFDIPLKLFLTVRSGEEYTIQYLPNSMYVIDIIDNDGVSLMKK